MLQFMPCPLKIHPLLLKLYLQSLTTRFISNKRSTSGQWIFKFGGDASLWRNNSDVTTNLIEFVNSQNNPDGQLKKAVLHGPNVKYIYDRVDYWPYFTAISTQADEDIMLFSNSKLTGHTGSRFG